MAGRLSTLVYCLFVAVVALALAPGCGRGDAIARDRLDPTSTHHELQATLWVQTAAENAAIKRQAFNSAGTQLERALADPTWTAALEQQPGYESLPPAVILDVDETVLENVPFQAEIVLANTDFSEELWEQWIDSASAEAVPGALEFVERCVELGVEVFFVTNRDADDEAKTRENLVEAGFPVSIDPDTLLTRGERVAWTGDKTARRRHVAESYRVLLLVGDDANDFMGEMRGVGVTRESRGELVDQRNAWWGERWFILPNPLYGSWEGALFDFNYELPDEEKMRLRFESLESFLEEE